MPYFPSNVLLHESIFSENYDNPHMHPARSSPYTMSPDPAASSHFLPSYFPPRAPQLVLSRPGTQQYVPTPYPPDRTDRTTNAEYDARTYREPSTSYNREGYDCYLSTILPGGQQWNPQPVYSQPRHVPSALNSNLVHLPPLANTFYGNPVYQYPAYESTGRYGVYIEPEGLYARGHAKSRPAYSQNAVQDGLLTTEPHLPTSRFSTSIASTPVLYRMSAKRPPGDQSYISAPQLESCLRKDLEGNVFIAFPHSFLGALWPDSRPLTRDIFEPFTFNKIWDDNNDSFVTSPLSFSECHMAEWLNTLGGMIGAFNGSERKRSWSAGTRDKQPDGASINRKPDLVLVDRSFVDKQLNSTAHPHISWTHIHAFAEVTKSYPIPKRIASTINDKSYLLFICQQDRRFVPALSFNGNGQFSLTLTDRQGQISTPFTSFLHGKDNAFIFMTILASLMYGPLHRTGRDKTMELCPDGRVKAIFVNDHRYEVVYLIYSLQSMVGRGTTIWLVIRDNRYYILKDSWIQTSRVESEIEFLEKLKDDLILQGHVPQLVEGEDVLVDGVVDSTGRYRMNVGGLHDARTHRRLVISPVGNPITTFKSIVEFINAIIDIVRVLERLHGFHKMLHRDISPNNLMLAHFDGENVPVRKGLLIDFDYAALFEAQGERVISTGFRTGTPPFMAIDLMLHHPEEPDKPFLHDLHHDLESILYVILWICTSMEGPGIERRVVDPYFMDLPLHKWFDKDADIRTLGYMKLGHVVDSERAILRNFPPFWDPFKPYIRELLAAFFPIHPISGSHITPKAMIDILTGAVKNTDAGTAEPSDMAPDSSNSDIASYNEIFRDTTLHSYLSATRKRSRRDEASGHQSKKGKKNTDQIIFNFENWTASVEERLSRRPVTQIDG